jgi:hypothetical protein
MVLIGRQILPRYCINICFLRHQAAAALRRESPYEYVLLISPLAPLFAISAVAEYIIDFIYNIQDFL